MIVVDDGNGYRSMYAHFSKIVVKKGQTIKAGQFLGYEGMTGRASGCHLHYGLFSPQETDQFGIDAAVAKRMKLPRLVIARIDPHARPARSQEGEEGERRPLGHDPVGREAARRPRQAAGPIRR